ncbi:ABC transporter permease, partial [Treponema sp. R6D11]
MSENLTRKKSKIFRELNTIITIMARDITLCLKDPGIIIMSLAMPIMMMYMIGGNLMQNMASGMPFDFGRYMMVGMLVNMMFMLTSMNMTSLVDDHETDFTQEMLISPVSRSSIIIGKIFGSMFGAIISIVGTLIVGLCMGITLPISKLLLILAMSPLVCLTSGALAMILIGLIKNKKSANLAVNLVVMPQMFLSGAIIPIANSTGVLWFLSRCLPMTYCLDLARAAVYNGTKEYAGVVMFNPIINFLAIAGI